MNSTGVKVNTYEQQLYIFGGILVASPITPESNPKRAHQPRGGLFTHRLYIRRFWGRERERADLDDAIGLVLLGVDVRIEVRLAPLDRCLHSAGSRLIVES